MGLWETPNQSSILPEPKHKKGQECIALESEMAAVNILSKDLLRPEGAHLALLKTLNTEILKLKSSSRWKKLSNLPYRIARLPGLELALKI